jgi:hypothetical protein
MQTAAAIPEISDGILGRPSIRNETGQIGSKRRARSKLKNFCSELISIQF